jgi:hypothetical protein
MPLDSSFVLLLSTTASVFFATKLICAWREYFIKMFSLVKMSTGIVAEGESLPADGYEIKMHPPN